MGTVAIFGGTFNPIHVGHTKIVEKLSELSFVDRILIMPTKIPPHKNVDFLASERDRVKMCELIASRFEKAEVCELELNREGKSYTVDTVSAVKDLFPEDDVAITIGGDMLVSFTAWKNYKDILKNARIITFPRRGIDKADYLAGAEALRNLGADVFCVDCAIEDISSTVIRNALNERADTSAYLEPEVAEYIRENNLYGG